MTTKAPGGSSGDRQSRETGPVAIRYLGQAGFQFKTSAGLNLVVDPYLSDCVEKAFGFKRMQPAVCTAEQLAPDLVLATHAHLDHLDTDSLAAFAACPETIFVGAEDCAPAYRAAGLPERRFHILKEGEQLTVRGVSLRAIYADHGELAPAALGFMIEVGGVTIYNVGDSGYCPQRICQSLGRVAVDVMIAPINGAFGNLDAKEACALAAQIKPAALIASHFWMFIEQGGDPAAFLAEAKRLGLSGIVMAPGEILRFGKGGISKE